MTYPTPPLPSLRFADSIPRIFSADLEMQNENSFITQIAEQVQHEFCSRSQSEHTTEDSTYANFALAMNTVANRNMASHA
jgi:hypothetical protein